MLLVQCDFDGTVAEHKVGNGLMDAFASPDWKDIESEYYSGKYSVEENNVLQYRMLKASLEDIEDYVNRTVRLRRAFGQFADYCEAEGIRLVIVSSGLDAYIGPALSKHGLEGVEIYSGKARFGLEAIQVDYLDPSGVKVKSGFKESYVRHFKSLGYSVVYLGDGTSDVVPALEADYVIARSSLARHFQENGLAHYAFEDFDDVKDYVASIKLDLEEQD